MLSLRSLVCFKKMYQLSQFDAIRNLSKSVKNNKCCKNIDSCKCNANISYNTNLLLAERQIDHNSLTWILTLMDKDRLKLTDDQLGDFHGHSGGSWSWTNYQIKVIREKGFNYWFYKTDGPLGYGHALKKIF